MLTKKVVRTRVTTKFFEMMVVGDILRPTIKEKS